METDIEVMIGTRVRLGRQMANLSQEDLAKKAGQTQWQISHTETAQRHTTVADLATIAAALERPISWFFGEDVDIAPRSLRSANRDLPPEAAEELRVLINAILGKYAMR